MSDEIKALEDEGGEPKVKKVVVRRKFRDDSWTDEQVEARRLELTVPEVPEGWVKLSDAADECRARSIPVTKLVKATGGDRCMKEPVDPMFKTVYVGRTRYLSPAVLTAGMDYMAAMKVERAPRAKKVKEEGDGEVGPAKSSKKGKAPANKPVVQVRPAPQQVRPDDWS